MALQWFQIYHISTITGDFLWSFWRVTNVASLSSSRLRLENPRRRDRDSVTLCYRGTLRHFVSVLHGLFSFTFSTVNERCNGFKENWSIFFLRLIWWSLLTFHYKKKRIHKANFVKFTRYEKRKLWVETKSFSLKHTSTTNLGNKRKKLSVII